MTTLSVKSVILGDPASPRHQINPFELNLLLEQIQNLAALNANFYFEDTLAGLIALGSVADGSIGFVLDDAGNTGTWRREVGAWILTASLPPALVAAETADASGFAILTQKNFPGETSQNFTQTLDGPTAASLDVIGEIADTSAGSIMRLTGAKTIGVRERVLIEADRRYEIEWSVQRFQDPTDPAGDAVRIGVQFLNGLKQPLQDVVIEDITLFVADGIQSRSRFITDQTVLAQDIEPPAGSVYMVPYVKTFGADGITNILKLGWDKVARVARSFYVTADGSDSNNGGSLSSPLATIGEGLLRAGQLGGPCAVIVYPGEYEVQPDTEIPADVLLYGYDLRVTKLRLPAGQEVNNMFLMNSGIKVRGFTFTNLQHNAFTFDPATESYEPPNKGYAFAFKSGIVITRSPYISDCSQLHDFTQDQMAAPIDRAAGNPDMPLGGGNIYADGSVIDADSPLRSVVVDSFTAINPNGVGYVMRRNAFAQLVSVFTNWSRVGLWSHEGGQMTVANSNNTFGDYSMAATGFRRSILIPDTDPSELTEEDAAAAIIDSNFEAIVTDCMTRYQSIPDWSASYDVLAERDTRTILKAMANDLRSGQERAMQRVTKAFFNWNAEFAISTSLIPIFVASWDEIEAELFERISTTSARSMITRLFDMIKDVFASVEAQGQNSPYVTVFGSVVEATGQQLSNAGSGVNYNSLPSSQRGTGGNLDPTSTLIEQDGGRIYATFSTEVGDTYLGKDLRVDFERSTIEGQAFSRGVQNISLPLIIGIGG